MRSFHSSIQLYKRQRICKDISRVKLLKKRRICCNDSPRFNGTMAAQVGFWRFKIAQHSGIHLCNHNDHFYGAQDNFNQKDKTTHFSIKEVWRWSHRFRIKSKSTSGSNDFFLSHELSNKYQERYVESQSLRISSDTECVAKRLWVANSRAIRYCWCQGTGALIMTL